MCVCGGWHGVCAGGWLSLCADGSVCGAQCGWLVEDGEGCFDYETTEKGGEDRYETPLVEPRGNWKWAGEWAVRSSSSCCRALLFSCWQRDCTTLPEMDENAWQYSVGWHHHYYSTAHSTSVVRRRRWVRKLQIYTESCFSDLAELQAEAANSPTGIGPLVKAAIDPKLLLPSLLEPS